MGTTPSGIRYPEGTEGVNVGHIGMKNIADDVDARGPVQYAAGTVAATTLGAAGGTLGATPGGLVVPAAPFTRLVAVRFIGTLGTLTAFAAFTFMRDGVQVATARGGVTQHPVLIEYFDVIPPSVSHNYSVNITSSAGVTLYASNTGFSSFTARSLGATTGSVANAAAAPGLLPAQEDSP